MTRNIESDYKYLINIDVSNFFIKTQKTKFTNGFLGVGFLASILFLSASTLGCNAKTLFRIYIIDQQPINDSL